MILMRWAVLLAAIGFAMDSGMEVAIAADQAGAEKSAPPRAVPRGSRIEGGQVNGHWREGTRLIDQLGQFKVVGDRASFTSADGVLHFDCLENLCAQRVARTVSDSPESLVWSITGELTEYRGTNFLLLGQAVLKPRADRALIHAPAAP